LGVEYHVPFLLSKGYKRGRLTLEKIINLLSTKVADDFNLSFKGRVSLGYDADFTINNLWDNQNVGLPIRKAKVNTLFLKEKFLNQRWKQLF
jgi:dihydroorotase-like cyclic amidohydrolase